MSPTTIISILRKTFSILFYPLLIGSLIIPIIGLRSIILDQSPAKGYQAPRGMDVAYEVNGVVIQDRELDHKTRFYSKDKLIMVSEKPIIILFR